MIAKLIGWPRVPTRRDKRGQPFFGHQIMIQTERLKAPGPVANVAQDPKWYKMAAAAAKSPMENLTTPLEPQHQLCPEHMRRGHETSDSKRF